MAHSSQVHTALVFFAQFGEELGIVDVESLLDFLGNDIVLEEAEVKQDQDVVEVDPGL